MCVAANGVAFTVIQPAVRDSWAALARGEAVSSGVGLGYWFSWYAGAHPPGGYSVIVPFLSGLIGAYAVAALGATAIPAAVAYAVSKTRHPLAATWVGALSAVLNLWSGRVTFLVGAALATWGMGLAMHKRPRRAALAVLLSGLASPVAVAFVLIGMGAGYLNRRVSWVPILAGLAFLGASAVIWGGSGPQGFGWASASFAIALCLLYFLAQPARPVRYALAITILAIVVVASIPNALGMNLARLVFAVLPVAVTATAQASWRRMIASVLPPLLWLGWFTRNDVRDAGSEASSLLTYEALTKALRQQSDINSSRVEVVADGTQTAAYVLGSEFWLGRGWETQADRKLSDAFVDSEVDMNPTQYEAWLKDASVGYVAINKRPVKMTGEWRLVHDHRPAAWQEVWSNDEWNLYRVPGVDPMVSGGRLLARGPDFARIYADKAATLTVRVAYSRYLTAKRLDGSPAEVTLSNATDGSDWTVVTTTGPVVFELRSRF